MPRISNFAFILSLFLFFVPIWLIAQIPSGYYNGASGKSGQELQVALYNIINAHTTLSYTPGVWDAFYKTDKKSNGKVWDMYSDVPGGTPPYEYTLGTGQCGTGGGGYEGSCYSREHSFPKSWFDDDSPMNTDLHHIFPVDQYVNGMHSNYPYGTVSSPTWTSQNGCKKGPCSAAGYTGTVFEPIDAYKGDFARAYFYMATCYQHVIAGWPAYDPSGAVVLAGNSYPAFKSWYVTMLMAWHTADPVSAKETARNDSVYKIQGNRNPYVDHPEYVAAVWDPGSSTKPEPAAHPSDFSAHSIHIQWTDATGTVTPDAYLIRMSPVGYSSIETPVDGVSYPNSSSDKNVASGIQEVWFSGLQANTTYYFKIFGYVYTEQGNDYKTDGSPLQTTQTTQP